ncbi:MAG: DUF4097 family beta strand repeat protein [Gammaproteobacteria bacterium]|nr:DUF4097 family beta strand repeat protein [Gammaproteobacteria bacterium]
MSIRRYSPAGALALLTLALLAAGPVVAHAEVVERTLAVKADGEVRVRNIAGHVEVRGWAREEVQLTARLSSAEQTLEVEESEAGISIKVIQPERGRRGGSAPATLELRVPDGARLQITTVSADIDVAGVNGEQTLQSVSGDTMVEGFGAQFKASSVSGDLQLRGQGRDGRTEVASVSGDVHLVDAAGALEASVVSGDFRIDGGRFSHVRLNAVSGDIGGALVLLPNARLEGNAVSGNLRIQLQEDVDARFDLQSFSGRIDDCDGHQAVRESRFGPGQRLTFSRGEGSSQVRAQTMSGRISICYR